MRLSELEAVVESLLFIAGDAVSLASIAQTIELDQATTRAVVLSLADKYEKEKRGLRIVEIADAYQMWVVKRLAVCRRLFQRCCITAVHPGRLIQCGYLRET